jgi:cell division septum initiation protein DivIVA
MTEPKDHLQRDVERTRRELGETVEALAHKVDVPGRVKEQAQETAGRVKEQAQETAVRVKEQAQETAERVKEQAQETRQRLTAATDEAIGSLPEPVAEQVEKARRHPGAIAAALIALIVAIWAISRRNR